MTQIIRQNALGSDNRASVWAVRYTMKTIFTSVFILFSCSINVNAMENKKHIVAMMNFVAPINEDESSFEAAILVCECTLAKAKNTWTDSEYSLFTEELINIKSPFLQKSKELNNSLKRLIPYIEECEEKFDTRVEF